MRSTSEKMKRGPNTIEEYVWKHALVFAQDRDMEMKRLKFVIGELKREVKRCNRCCHGDPTFGANSTDCDICGHYAKCDAIGCVALECSLCGNKGCWDCVYNCNEHHGHLVCLVCSGTNHCYCCLLFKRAVIVGCESHPLTEVEMPDVGKVFACKEHAVPEGWQETIQHIPNTLRLTSYYVSKTALAERILPMP